MQQSDAVIYQFSRDFVERGKYDHFLRVFGRHALPSGPALRAMLNSLHFVVEGYDTDPRELFAIPEVRNFFSSLFKAWPYPLYFASLAGDELRTVSMCCFSSLSAVVTTSVPRAQVICDPMEIGWFLQTHFGPMNELCAASGMTEKEIHERTRAIFAYFGLPF